MSRLRHRMTFWLCALPLCALMGPGCANMGLPRIDPSGEQFLICPGQPAPVVAPPGPFVPPSVAPPAATAVPAPLGSAPVLAPQPGLALSPSQLIAPVGSEVVMIATVNGSPGLGLSGERVEWMLAPDGPGQFVALGERGTLDCLNAIRGLPKKVDNKYAVNVTSTTRQLIDRGTPTPVDDIQLQNGQAWLTVTSPTEGTSHVTAYGPSVPGWDRHQQSATIFWVDAQWGFPPPAINPVGTRHVFSTSIRRQSDGAPLADYRVRYEITGGPEAGFAPDGASAIEVPSNELGLANVEIFQKKPVAGTNQISVEIIRPAGFGGGSGRRLPLGKGTTLKTWTSSDITLRVAGPTQATVGSVVTYRIEVSNPGGLQAKDVVITDQPPAGLTFLNSNPAANSSPSGQEWQLGVLGTQETRVIEVNFRVANPGTINYCASVSAADGLTAKECATTVVGAAASQLELRVTGPAQAQVGAEVQYEIEVINRGTTTAAGLIITDRFDAGLEHAISASPIERDFPDIAPGTGKKIAVTFRVTQPGELCQNVTVAGAGGLVASGRSCLTAIAAGEPTPADAPPVVTPSTPTQPSTPPGPIGVGRPSIHVTKTGPTRRRVGETAEFTIEVTNTGNTVLNNIRLADTYGLGLSATEATEGYTTNSRGELTWTIDELQPGRSIKRQVNCLCEQAVAKACNRATVFAEPNLTMAGEACLEITGDDAAGGAPAPAQLADNANVPGGLTLAVADQSDPLREGTENNYQIVLTNKSSAADKNVTLTVTIPPEMVLIMSVGPVRGTVVNDRLVKFTPIAEMRAGESVTFDVRTTALKAGTATLSVQVTSDRQRAPITDSETTEILSR